MTEQERSAIADDLKRSFITMMIELAHARPSGSLTTEEGIEIARMLRTLPREWLGELVVWIRAIATEHPSVLLDALADMAQLQAQSIPQRERVVN